MAENDLDSVFSNLNAKQRRAIEKLAAGGDKAAAAKAAGVSIRTLDRYLGEPTVRAALDRATGQVLNDATRRMIAGLDTAVSTMLDLVENAKTPAAVKLRAAVAIVECALKLQDAHDLAQRVARLEELLHEQNKNQS
ncbi:MAG: hypothetical protein KF770_13390 [Anaerolineae bacterium]|nr:hypothetical protein [Anaerolineae bacterium]